MSSSPVSLPAARRVAKVAEYLRELWRRREFTAALGLGNLKARNASTSLGLIWWVLNPVLLGGVYFLIFGVLFGSSRPPDFLAYLLTGMFVFHFTSQAMTGGANSIIQNAKLLANLRFPRLILPISTLLESLVGFVASLFVLLAVVIATDVMLDDQQLLNVRLVYLPLIILIQLLFNLGLGGITARLAVPFRDINNLLPYINRIWLYLTPIIWPLTFLDRADEALQQIVRLNPMYHIVGLYRGAFLNYPVNAEMVLSAVAWSVVIGVLGVGLFVKHEGHMVRYL